MMGNDSGALDAPKRVHVFLVGGDSFWGRVVYRPVAEGDAWHIVDNLGRSHFVQHFEEIVESLETLEAPDDPR